MDPNPDKLKENVTLNFRHLKVTPAIKPHSRLAHISLKTFKLNLLSAGCRRQETACFGQASGKEGECQVTMIKVKIQGVDCCSTPLPGFVSMLSRNKGSMLARRLSFISDKFTNCPDERRNRKIMLSFLSFCGNSP